MVCLRVEKQADSALDSDAATWSPQGRLHQVEYAIEAIKVLIISGPNF
jgi:Proteasome subunit A N-terminal signature